MGGERVRYVREETLGLSVSRNRAIRESRGDYILFLDDDAIARPGWMEAVVALFEKDRSIGCVGGRIDPVWEGGEPDWLPDMFKTLYTVLDYSPVITEMEAPRIPFGANVAFRASLFKQHAPFREDLGRVGSNLLSSEESELIDRIRATHKVYYTPHAIVDHKIAKSRISRKWFLRRVYWQGISDAARGERGTGYLIKQAVRSALPPLCRCSRWPARARRSFSCAVSSTATATLPGLYDCTSKPSLFLPAWSHFE